MSLWKDRFQFWCKFKQCYHPVLTGFSEWRRTGPSDVRIEKQAGQGQAWDPATMATLLLGDRPVAGGRLRFGGSLRQSVWRIQSPGSSQPGVSGWAWPQRSGCSNRQRERDSREAGRGGTQSPERLAADIGDVHQQGAGSSLPGLGSEKGTGQSKAGLFFFFKSLKK